jgi:hypothetical protein
MASFSSERAAVNWANQCPDGTYIMLTSPSGLKEWEVRRMRRGRGKKRNPQSTLASGFEWKKQGAGYNGTFSRPMWKGGPDEVTATFYLWFKDGEWRGSKYNAWYRWRTPFGPADTVKKIKEQAAASLTQSEGGFDNKKRNPAASEKEFLAAVDQLLPDMDSDDHWDPPLIRPYTPQDWQWGEEYYVVVNDVSVGGFDSWEEAEDEAWEIQRAWGRFGIIPKVYTPAEVRGRGFQVGNLYWALHGQFAKRRRNPKLHTVDGWREDFADDADVWTVEHTGRGALGGYAAKKIKAKDAPTGEEIYRSKSEAEYELRRFTDSAEWVWYPRMGDAPERNPVRKVKGGWQWGDSGKVYKRKADADKQAQAIYASGWRERNPERN